MSVAFDPKLSFNVLIVACLFLHLLVYFFYHYRCDINKITCQKKVDKDDDEWEVSPRAKSSCEACIIHCTKSTEKLTQLVSIESWKSLLNTARIRQHQSILEIVARTKEGYVPHLQYHRKCRNLFAKKGMLDRITKKRQVYFRYFIFKQF